MLRIAANKWMSVAGLLLLVAACGTTGVGPAPTPTHTPAATPTGGAFDAGSGIVADGQLEPAAYARLSFAAGGLVAEVLVVEGEAVRAGDVIARLAHSEALAAEQARAVQAVLEAELALRALTEADPAVVAQARVEATRTALELDDARRALQQLRQPNVAYYLADVERARTALTAAEENVRLVEIGPTAQALETAQAGLEAASTLLQDATNGQAQCPECVEVYAGGRMWALKDVRAENDAAQRAVEAAQIQHGQAEREAAAAVEARQTELDQAEARLAAVQNPSPSSRAIRLAEIEVAAAEARLAAAEARLAEPDPAEVGLAEARVESARATSRAANDALAALELRSPLDGVLVGVAVQPGESVSAGQPAFTLAQLDRWVVTTTNLTEMEVVWLEEGATATVRLDALPGETFGARLVGLGQTYMQHTGDVVYTATLTLDAADPRWRWGMTAEVLFDTQPASAAH